MKRCTLDTNIITAFLKNDSLPPYLKKEGNLIEDADIFMASTAIVEELVLITNNIKHFKRVKELRLDNWLQN